MTGEAAIGALCRDCGVRPPAGSARCPACGSPRLLRHPELYRLTIAHLDCDAFYASVEKRDRPDLAHRPVIVGGGRRGVVAAACYIARLSGVRSAMPMFQALELCPDAVVLRPEMARYAEVSRQIRALMLELTPRVQPLSLDEAYLDLAGTEALGGGSAAEKLAALARRIDREIGIGVSIGLAPNKMLAKIASDLDKPRGFAVIGAAEAEAFLAPRPVTILPGVGRVTAARLAADGIHTVGDLARVSESALIRRHGRFGHRLHAFSRGLDTRPVDPEEETVSVSAETTFADDIAAPAALKRALMPLCERVAARLKRKDLAGRTVVLKLKTRQFRLLTRSRQLRDPTQLAATIHAAAAELVERAATGERFRLIGVACTDLVPGRLADPPDLLDPTPVRRRAVDEAVEAVRARYGGGAISRGLPGRPPR